MRYLVISPCEDARTGVLFAVGDEFLPEPDVDQGERLVKAGCLRVIPDNAPDLPGNPDAVQEALALREQLQRAGNTIDGLNDRLATASSAHSDLVDEFKAVRVKLDAANDQLRELDVANARVKELEGLLAEATKPATQPDDADTTGQQTLDTSPPKPAKKG